MHKHKDLALRNLVPFLDDLFPGAYAAFCLDPKRSNKSTEVLPCDCCAVLELWGAYQVPVTASNQSESFAALGPTF